MSHTYHVPPGQWSYIAETAHTLNQGLQELHQQKIVKDGQAIAADGWSKFLSQTTTYLHQAHSMTDVSNDLKTGNLSAIMHIPDHHPDSHFNGKTLADYLHHGLSQQQKELLQNIKNPVAKRLLTEKIQSYLPQVNQHVAELEAKLIEGKRYSLAVDALERYSKTVYSQPRMTNHLLDDFRATVDSLTLLPEEKLKLTHLAQEKLYYSAALGTIKANPSGFLADNNWKSNLDPATHFQLAKMAESQIRHGQARQVQELQSLSKSHFTSLLATGQGIAGFTNLVTNAYGKGSIAANKILHYHELYQQAGTIRVGLKGQTLAEGHNAIKALQPQAGDHDFAIKQQLYQILEKDLSNQLKQVKDDPAAYVEQLFNDGSSTHGTSFQGGIASEGSPQESLPFVERLKMRKVWQDAKGIPAYSQKLLMKTEKEDLLKSFHTSDPAQLEAAVNQLINLDDTSCQDTGIGKQVIQELMTDNKDVPILCNLYAHSKLFNPELATNVLRMIPIQKQLFSSMSNPEQKELEQLLTDNDDFTSYRNNLLAGNIHNLPQLEQLQEGIKYLSRFYQLERGMSMKTAVKQAVRDVITDTTITPLPYLTLPSKVIKDNHVITLDTDRVKRGLGVLHHNIINDTTPYDKLATFGQVGDNPKLQKEAEVRQKELLEEGHFRLSPDQRFIYYAIPLLNGFEQPLMISPNAVWHMPIYQLQEIEEEIRENDVSIHEFIP